MPVVKSVQEMVQNGVVAKVSTPGKKFLAYTMVNDVIRPLAGAEVKLEGFGTPSAVKVHLLSAKGAKYTVIVGSQWTTFWDVLNQDSLAPTTYGTVKNNATWKAIYNVGPASIMYWSGGTRSDQGGAATPVIEQEVLVCKECKLLMPLKAATVDHRNPKTGGEYAAMYKVFKAMNLAMDEPTGKKGQHLNARTMSLRKLPDFPSDSDLTYEGIGILSAILHGGQEAAFKEICVHHFLNLQPMCFRCNSQKGNWGYRES